MNKNIGKVACVIPARENEYFFALKSQNEELIAPTVAFYETIESLCQKYKPVSIISPTEQEFTQFIDKVGSIKLDYDYIAKQIEFRLKSENADDLYRSEPFYLKKVHVNKAKKLF